MRGIERLREGGIPVALNSTLGRDVVDNLDAYFDFIEEHRLYKVIFDRLVDVPREHIVSSTVFYAALQLIAEIKAERGLDWLEIGNLEAYKHALSGKLDRVCTMFGSACGSGFHNIIYMQRGGYPCGRMFGQQRWVPGRFDEPLDVFPECMAALVGGRGCSAGRVSQDAGSTGADLIERETPDYDPLPQATFVTWFSAADARARCSSSASPQGAR